MTELNPFKNYFPVNDEDDKISWVDLYNALLLSPLTPREKTVEFLTVAQETLMMAKDCLREEGSHDNEVLQAIEDLRTKVISFITELEKKRSLDITD